MYGMHVCLQHKARSPIIVHSPRMCFAMLLGFKLSWVICCQQSKVSLQARRRFRPNGIVTDNIGDHTYILCACLLCLISVFKSGCRCPAGFCAVGWLGAAAGAAAFAAALLQRAARFGNKNKFDIIGLKSSIITNTGAAAGAAALPATFLQRVTNSEQQQVMNRWLHLKPWLFVATDDSSLCARPMLHNGLLCSSP